jgi:hypothetical protein
LSLTEVVVTLRAFLRFEFSQGVLPRPLHEQIDTPRVYPGERLPRALAWDRCEPCSARSIKRDPTGCETSRCCILPPFTDCAAVSWSTCAWRTSSGATPFYK